LTGSRRSILIYNLGVDPRWKLSPLPSTALALALWGCASQSSLAPGASQVELIQFPGGKYLVISSHILHEVHLFFEMDRPAGKDEQPQLDRPPGGEIYTAGFPGESPAAHHRFAYEEGNFEVGGFRYPAERNGLLFILKDRPGPFTFLFRGRRVTIERGGKWKPAVLYRAVEVKEEISPPPAAQGRRRSRVTTRRTVSRVVQEDLQAGPHHIVAPSDSSEWTVNGLKVSAPPGASIAIDGQGAVRSSR
jgi:hypothetical protein